jgi:putative thioredoxin
MKDTQSTWIFDVGDADFAQAVVERSRQTPVVVDFWAPWCGPCRMIGPILERLVRERNGEVLLAKVNVDEAQAVALQFGISSIPAVIAFRGGRPVLDFVGALPEPQLRSFLDEISPTQAERAASRAADLERERPEEAEALYRQALREDSNQEAAILGLARLLMSNGKDQEAAELLDRVGPGGEQGEEAERLSAMLFLKNLCKDFGDQASLQERVAAKSNDAQAKYEVGCVLARDGKYAEALQTLFRAAEMDPKLAQSKVREAMVKIFQIVGVRSDLANDYRDRLSLLLY